MLWSILYKDNRKILSFVRKILRENIVVSENRSMKIKQNRLILVSNCITCGKANPGSLKIKKRADYWAS